MSTVGVERVGTYSGGPYAGKLRLKFTVFGDPTRLMQLATELTELGSEAAIMRKMESAIDRDDKILFALRMIETWTEVVRRLMNPIEIAADRSLNAGQLTPTDGKTRR